MAAATTIALVSAGVAAAGTIGSYFEQKKAGRKAKRAQEQANRVSQASAQIDNARRRRRAIAQARIAQAQNVSSQGQAVQTSSALRGVNASLGSQLGANIGAQQQQVNSQQQIMNFGQQASNALRKGQERAGLWSTFGSLGQMGFNAAAPNTGWGTTQSSGAGANVGLNRQGQNFALTGNSAFVSRM